MKIIEEAAAQALKAMESGEKLLWAGSPDPFSMARAKAHVALLGAAVLVILLLIPFPAASGPEDAALAPVRYFIYYPFLFLAAYCLLAPAIAYQRALTTVYAATDRRLLTLREGEIADFAWIDAVEPPAVDRGGRGSGDVIVPRRRRSAEREEFKPDFRFPCAKDADGLCRVVAEQVKVHERTAEREADHYLDLLLLGGRERDDRLFQLFR